LGGIVAEERVQRRLAAILAADVVGYSRLMEADEEDTRARLRSLQSDLIDPQIAADGGRLVKTTGDGILVEFPSAVNAVRNALAIQSAMAEHNANVSDDRRLVFRVGINIGDVIIEGEDIHGDGVNVAARLEGLCEPGEVYISGTVRDHVEGKLTANFHDLGDQTVKNISRPVRVFRVNSQSRDASPVADVAEPLPLPDKPSIAVLPFDNQSGDPEQEYFADGIAEDIITGLSRFHWFFVIARNSSFSFKGSSPDVRTVAHELGVQYVLKGSVRKAGNRVRITAQLIDGTTGSHVWAERYDRDLEDIFAVQDEITSAITGAVAPSFASAEAQRIKRKAPENLHAWDYAIHGNWHLWHLDREHLAEARKLFQAAIDLDPKNVLALSGLALVCSWEVVWGWAEDPDALREFADETASRAVAADEHDAWAQAVFSTVSLHRRRLDAAARAARRAIELNPNLAAAEFALGAAPATCCGCFR
jgi:adenylate cyclase